MKQSTSNSWQISIVNKPTSEAEQKYACVPEGLVAKIAFNASTSVFSNVWTLMESQILFLFAGTFVQNQFLRVCFGFTFKEPGGGGGIGTFDLDGGGGGGGGTFDLDGGGGGGGGGPPELGWGAVGRSCDFDCEACRTS